MSQKKKSKGTVVVEAIRERLRLRWSYQGQRYYLYLELPDSMTNRKVGEAKAKLIESHMAMGVFDRTLMQYRPAGSRQQTITVVELFEKFVEYKSKQVLPQSMSKYPGLIGYLRQYFRAKTANQITELDAQKFKDWLAKRIAPVTLRERISLLNAGWNWALKKKLVLENPWSDISIKIPRKKVDAFTKDETRSIIEEFRSDPHASHYADYVEFVLGVGCRLGEAIALRWKHLTPDCLVVWIGESYYRGSFQGTKTGEDRFFELSPALQTMLQRRKPEGAKADDLVFTSPKGQPISDQNFCKRYWKLILEKAAVRYRKPRNSRHTFASHALDQGRSPGEVSAITGHSIETLYRNYAGNVKSRPKVPELWTDDK